MAGKRGFGQITKMRSGRYQARYTGPTGELVTAPETFVAKADAEGWLATERKLTEQPDTWTPPKARAAALIKARAEAEATKPETFAEYAARWIVERRVKGRPLAARTRDHYNSLLQTYLVPAFGPLPLDAITPQAVNLWYDHMTVARKRTGDTGETTKAHTYSLARAIMNTAVSAHGPLVGHVNPFAVRGGGSSPTTKRTQLVTSDELAVILETIRPEWRAMVQLALWTGLRFSELAELRRSDVDLDTGMLRVRRSVSRSKVDGVHIKGPKSDAGVRDMHLPDAVVPALRSHLNTYVTGRDGLLFPGSSGQHLAPATFYGGVTKTRRVKDAAGRKRTVKVRAVNAGSWYAAREAAGRPDLHFHDLRATGATLLAQAGATEAEIQAFLGDSTPQAAQRYVRAARSRMKMLSGRLSAMAEGGNW